MYFGTDGIRDLAEFFNEDFLQKTAEAIAGLSGVSRIVIGRDTRTSGAFISKTLSEKLAALGVEVLDMGIAPTPLVSFYLKHVHADLGIVVSASHNPPEYNGIKIFNRLGEKPSAEEEAELEFLMDNPKKVVRPPLEVAFDCGAIDAYSDFLKSKFSDLRGLKVALDCANGAMSVLAPTVFLRLGAEITAFKCDTHGANINDNCGATSIGFLRSVTDGGEFDIGFAFDGDGDRVIAIRDGAVYDGDWEMCVLANARKEEIREIVGTVMTNSACEKYLAENGVGFIRTDVGDKFVWEEMKRRGAKIGGEKAGHIILSELVSTGDGLTVAAALAETLSKSSEKWIVPCDYPETSLTVSASKEQKAAFESSGIREKLLGEAKAMAIRLVVRPSGTEPKIRITAESQNGEAAKAFAIYAESTIKELFK